MQLLIQTAIKLSVLAIPISPPLSLMAQSQIRVAITAKTMAVVYRVWPGSYNGIAFLKISLIDGKAPSTEFAILRFERGGKMDDSWWLLHGIEKTFWVTPCTPFVSREFDTKEIHTKFGNWNYLNNATQSSIPFGELLPTYGVNLRDEILLKE